jgi:tRNA-2-methylthio-N6-dimethylallyladenosine synthase
MTSGTAKKLYIKTWGCQMNVYDSLRMADVLSPLGYKPVEAPEDADMIILNTCHIREKATDKVFSELGRLRAHKTRKEKSGGKMLMAVAGCVAQAEGDIILERAPYVDMVFGPQSLHELPEMMIKSGHERVISTDFAPQAKFDSLDGEQSTQGPSAFLSIQEGCDKFCTFCVVPYTRGAEYSRRVEPIIDEAKRLIDQGSVEITLLGQNVNAFHGEDSKGKIWGLADLIHALHDLPGLARIRYTTSHPRDMNNTLIGAHALPKLMPFLHLPVQSGSDKILKAMNRKHTADSYRNIIADLRKARPDIAFSSDFIIGFPGETEEDFEATMQLVRDVRFASAYSFTYSARPGTPAANMQNLVAPKIAAERLARLQALILAQSKAFNETFTGRTLPVLFDRKGKKNGQIQGRSPYNQSVYVTAPERLLGHIMDVEINAAFDNSLTGDVSIK